MDADLLRPLFLHVAQVVNTEHLLLGSAGKKRTSVNAFGDHTLVADFTAEATVIELLKGAGLRMRVIAEEHGELLTDPNPEYTLVLDGLDGSSLYERATEEDIRLGRARYGTMFGLFRGTEPKYGDGLISCIVEHSTRRLLMAEQGRGATVQYLDGRAVSPARSSRNPLNPGFEVFCEVNDPTWGPRLSEFVKPLAKHHIIVTSTGSTARHYFDVATGASSATIEWSRKRNLELMIAYLIMVEAGGTVIRLDGTDLGSYKYDELALNPDDMECFIAAANVRVAEKLQTFLTANN